MFLCQLDDVALNDSLSRHEELTCNVFEKPFIGSAYSKKFIKSTSTDILYLQKRNCEIKQDIKKRSTRKSCMRKYANWSVKARLSHGLAIWCCSSSLRMPPRSWKQWRSWSRLATVSWLTSSQSTCAPPWDASSWLGPNKRNRTRAVIRACWIKRIIRVLSKFE